MYLNVWKIITIDSNEIVSIIRDSTFNHTKVHSHEFIEIEYVISGCGVQIINGKKFDVNKGDILFFNVGDKHEYFSTKNMQLVNCIIKPEFFKDDMNLINELPEITHLKGREVSVVEDLLKNIESEFQNKKNCYKLCLAAYVNLLVSTLVRAQKKNMNDTLEIKEAIKQYVDNHIDSVTLSNISNAFNFSASYFGKLFKGIFNETFTSYIIKARMKKAFELVTETDLPITVIIGKIGYADKKNFYKHFKQYTGVTPKQLRVKNI